MVFDVRGAPGRYGCGRGRGRLAGLVALVLAAAPALSPSAARAQPAEDGSPSAADRESARTLMDQGVEREEAKDHEGALKLYQGAHALVRLPMTGVAVARAQASLGQYVEAVDTATQVKLMPKRPDETPAYDQARAEAEALIQRLVDRTPSLQVSVLGASGPVQVAVAIDGVAVPQAALGLRRKVNPGRHVVTASAPGHRQARVELEAPEGTVVPVTLRLEPEAGARAAGAQGAGKPRSAAPSSVTAPARATATGGGPSPIIYVSLGVGAAGLVLGGVTGALALARTTDLEDRCPGGRCDPSLRGDIEAAGVLSTVSNIGFTAGFTGAGLGVLGLLLSGGGEARRAGAAGAVVDAARVRLMPAVGPGALGLRGVF